ncbi:MAG: LemA family protein [Clostridia bacterium]|nr:LemA family protein [Clostridia bacterium]
MEKKQNTKSLALIGKTLLFIIFAVMLISVVLLIIGIFNKNTVFIILGAIITFIMLIFILNFISKRNDMIRAYNKVQESLSLIDIQLKLRFDLIPNLVAVVKGYARHERAVFKEITKLRNLATLATTEEEKLDYANKIVPKMREIVALAEDYPDIKADALFKSLMAELVIVEDKIVAARRFYDSNVSIYNTKLDISLTTLLQVFLGMKG